MRRSKGLFYDDIWATPRHLSTLDSRDKANTSVVFAGKRFQFPIIAAPMPDVCDRNMAMELSNLGGLGIIHRFQSIEEQCKDLNNKFPYGAAIGVTGDYLERFEALYAAGCKVFCIDVANGFSLTTAKCFVEIKKRHSDIWVIAGNVASKEGFQFLSELGVDAVRCGIAGGCFTKDTLVQTDKGKVKIDKIRLGDMVLTHTGKYKKVTAKLERLEEECLIDVNGIKCTKNHEFYVIKRFHKGIVNEDNINQYAFWVSAEELSDDYLLIKSTETTTSNS